MPPSGPCRELGADACVSPAAGTILPPSRPAWPLEAALRIRPLPGNSMRAADGDGVNRQAGARVFRPWKLRKPQVKDRFCKPICKPDAAGQAETGEMQKAGDDLTPQVGRGQRGDQRLPETAETHVGRLITQRRPAPGRRAPRERSRRGLAPPCPPCGRSFTVSRGDLPAQARPVRSSHRSDSQADGPDSISVRLAGYRGCLAAGLRSARSR